MSKVKRTPEEELKLEHQRKIQERMLEELRIVKKQQAIQELIWEGQSVILELRELLDKLRVIRFPDSMFESYPFCYKYSVLKSKIME